MYNSSVFTLFLVGLEQLISQSVLHSFIAQAAFRTIVFLPIACLHLLVSTLNGCVCAGFYSTKLGCVSLLHASSVYRCAPE